MANIPTFQASELSLVSPYLPEYRNIVLTGKVSTSARVDVCCCELWAGMSPNTKVATWLVYETEKLEQRLSNSIVHDFQCWTGELRLPKGLAHLLTTSASSRPGGGESRRVQFDDMNKFLEYVSTYRVQLSEDAFIDSDSEDSDPGSDGMGERDGRQHTSSTTGGGSDESKEVKADEFHPSNPMSSGCETVPPEDLDLCCHEARRRRWTAHVRQLQRELKSCRSAQAARSENPLQLEKKRENRQRKLLEAERREQQCRQTLADRLLRQKKANRRKKSTKAQSKSGAAVAEAEKKLEAAISTRKAWERSRDEVVRKQRRASDPTTLRLQEAELARYKRYLEGSELRSVGSTFVNRMICCNDSDSESNGDGDGDDDGDGDGDGGRGGARIPPEIRAQQQRYLRVQRNDARFTLCCLLPELRARRITVKGALRALYVVLVCRRGSLLHKAESVLGACEALCVLFDWEELMAPQWLAICRHLFDTLLNQQLESPHLRALVQLATRVESLCEVILWDPTGDPWMDELLHLQDSVCPNLVWLLLCVSNFGGPPPLTDATAAGAATVALVEHLFGYLRGITSKSYHGFLQFAHHFHAMSLRTDRTRQDFWWSNRHRLLLRVHKVQTAWCVTVESLAVHIPDDGSTLCRLSNVIAKFAVRDRVQLLPPRHFGDWIPGCDQQSIMDSAHAPFFLRGDPFCCTRSDTRGFALDYGEPRRYDVHLLACASQGAGDDSAECQCRRSHARK